MKRLLRSIHLYAMRRNLALFILVIGLVTVNAVSGFSPCCRSLVQLPSLAQYHSTSSSLHAAKGGGGGKVKRGVAQTTKGFGAPPPKLDDVLSSFKSRMPINATENSCPCGSGKIYAKCCQQLHSGERRCLSITDVLRSRYTAFSYRNIGYIMSTTHETCRDYRPDRVAWATEMNRNGMFDSFDFVNLSIGEEEMSAENENEGYVEFKVTFQAKKRAGDDESVVGQRTVITERSRFLRNPSDNSWSYASGDVRSDVAGLEGTTLNKKSS